MHNVPNQTSCYTRRPPLKSSDRILSHMAIVIGDAHQIRRDRSTHKHQPIVHIFDTPATHYIISDTIPACRLSRPSMSYNALSPMYSAKQASNRTANLARNKRHTITARPSRTPIVLHTAQGGAQPDYRTVHALSARSLPLPPTHAEHRVEYSPQDRSAHTHALQTAGAARAYCAPASSRTSLPDWISRQLLTQTNVVQSPAQSRLWIIKDNHISLATPLKHTTAGTWVSAHLFFTPPLMIYILGPLDSFWIRSHSFWNSDQFISSLSRCI